MINSKPNGAKTIYASHKEEIPIGIYVYVLLADNIPKEKLLSPSEVFEAGVPDALISGEWWLLEETEFIQVGYFSLTFSPRLKQGDS